MSRDGYLPDDVSDARFNAAFPPECPDSCRSMQVVYSDCGGVGRCECFPDTLRGRLAGFLQGACAVDEDPACDCPTPAEVRAERDEARDEARIERKIYGGELE